MTWINWNFKRIFKIYLRCRDKRSNALIHSPNARNGCSCWSCKLKLNPDLSWGDGNQPLEPHLMSARMHLCETQSRSKWDINPVSLRRDPRVPSQSLICQLKRLSLECFYIAVGSVEWHSCFKKHFEISSKCSTYLPFSYFTCRYKPKRTEHIYLYKPLWRNTHHSIILNCQKVKTIQMPLGNGE